jgi:hypothetical protein
MEIRGQDVATSFFESTGGFGVEARAKGGRQASAPHCMKAIQML